MNKATFGAGCFWGVEAEFRKIKGVLHTSVGFEGGHTEHPTYQEVCTDKTGHAEVVQVEYDPNEISFAELLDVFWENHDPTQVNRQGPDFGTQYRSVIFYQNDEERRIAEESKKAIANSKGYHSPIATEIIAASTFWRAEEYHQQYLEKNGLAHCHI